MGTGNKRELGNSGLKIAPLALGGNVFGWTADEKTSFRLLDAFTAGGGDLIDTADMYSTWVPGHKGGESETVLGKWLGRGGNRQKVLIATKVGKEMGPDRKGLSKSYILRAAEDSLKRLQTDHIDLYQTHEDDPDTPLEETLCAIDQGREGAGDRSVELQRGTSRQGLAGQRETRTSRLPEPSAFVQSPRTYRV